MDFNFTKTILLAVSMEFKTKILFEIPSMLNGYYLKGCNLDTHVKEVDMLK